MIYSVLHELGWLLSRSPRLIKVATVCRVASVVVGAASIVSKYEVPKRIGAWRRGYKERKQTPGICISCGATIRDSSGCCKECHERYTTC